MTQTTTQVAEVQTKPVAKYIEQRAKRTRFSFGNAWLNAVLAGVVSDQPKLVAHAVKLKVGQANDLSQLSIADLLPQVQTAIYAAPADQIADAE